MWKLSRKILSVSIGYRKGMESLKEFLIDGWRKGKQDIAKTRVIYNYIRGLENNPMTSFIFGEQTTEKLKFIRKFAPNFVSAV